MQSLNDHYDVVILGSGPAGLQAAIHAARKKVSVLVLGRETKSSLFHAHIENFCCVFSVTGEEILSTGRQQAAQFGTHFSEEDVLKIDTTEKGFELTLESQRCIPAQALIIATGTQRQRLGVPGEKALIGKGVSYCVDCDGNFYKGETVAVVGGESAAVDGTLTLTDIARSVHLIYDELQVGPALEQRLAASPVQSHPRSAVQAILGDNQVEGIRLDDDSVIPVSGVFIEQGAKGLMELATRLGILLDDETRFIQTDKQQATNIPGVFAAGDVCGPPWQMAKAVGEGCVAGINAAQFAKRNKS